LNSRTSL
ncbi:putative surface adhesion domain protein, partial [Vibrio parahaemolyticus VP2007-007]